MSQHNAFEPPQDLRALRAHAQLIELAAAAVLVRELSAGSFLFWNRGAEEVYGWTVQLVPPNLDINPTRRALHPPATSSSDTLHGIRSRTRIS